ncbi:MAG: HAMP domain-containing sensor histidine kinase [Lagierella massiliensis]|nr:HAMP domain-containing sensor histidine kinase [Lagierella massiliensis]
MKLGKKNLLYSSLLVLFILVTLISYLAFLLPNLYVEHSISTTAKEIEQSHLEDIKGNPSVEFSKIGSRLYIEVDKDFNRIDVKSPGVNGYFDISSTPIRENLKNIEMISKPDKNGVNALTNEKKAKIIEENLKEMGEYFQNNVKIEGIEQNLKLSEGFSISDENSYTSFKKVNHNTISLVFRYRDGNLADYINYCILTNDKDMYKVTLSSFIAPRIDDLLPVVLESLPMIVLVLIVVVLLISELYSRKLVNPIVKIQRFVEDSKFQTPNYQEINFEGKDEIALLARDLVVMEKTLRDSIEKLRMESERKSIFTRSATHQLKTPLAASILLCDGMINNLGKYEDRDKYLKVMKKELLEMNNMVQQILITTKENRKPNYMDLDLKEFFDREIERYKFKADEKNLSFSLLGKSNWNVDYEFFEQIVDNILQNCVNYTENNGSVTIKLKQDKVSFYNEKAKIPEAIKESIMDPFVSTSESKSKGLGLYITKYYCDILGLEISVENCGEGVLTELRRVYND